MSELHKTSNLPRGAGNLAVQYREDVPHDVDPNCVEDGWQDITLEEAFQVCKWGELMDAQAVLWAGMSNMAYVAVVAWNQDWVRMFVVE